MLYAPHGLGATGLALRISRLTLILCPVLHVANLVFWMTWLFAVCGALIATYNAYYGNSTHL
jgi:hypothetical protein